MHHSTRATTQEQNPTSLPNGDLPIPPLISDTSSVSPPSSSGGLTTSSYQQKPPTLIRSGFNTWTAYLSSKPHLREILFVIPTGMKEERLTHLASIGGQLAGSSGKSIMDKVRRRAGLLSGLGSETKRAIGDTIQMAGQGLVLRCSLRPHRSCWIFCSIRFLSGLQVLPITSSFVRAILLCTYSSRSHSYLVESSHYGYCFTYSPSLCTILRLRR